MKVQGSGTEWQVHAGKDKAERQGGRRREKRFLLAEGVLYCTRLHKKRWVGGRGVQTSTCSTSTAIKVMHVASGCSGQKEAGKVMEGNGLCMTAKERQLAQEAESRGRFRGGCEMHGTGMVQGRRAEMKRRV